MPEYKFGKYPVYRCRPRAEGGDGGDEEAVHLARVESAETVAGSF
ncbi:hypothetical protein ACFLX5_01245 [Chloroflexota bacterium]